jgi:hypothetical protein
MLREEASNFIQEEVREASDPLSGGESAAPRPGDIRESPLSIILRRPLRHANEAFRAEAIEEMAARARWDSSRHWESAWRLWPRAVGEDMSEIRLLENIRELEEEFWGRVDAIIGEALEGRGTEADGEDEWRAGQGTDCD